MITAVSFCKRSICRLVFATMAILFLVFPLTAQSDELGEFLLKQITANPDAPCSEATLLLITRDLGWYEKHMGELSHPIQDQIHALRIRVVGESTRSAAEAMGEPADIFLASGSCKPGRDIDLLYVGKDARRARESIDAAIAQTTASILATHGDDPVLMAAIKQGIDVPKSLNSSAMDVVASDMPNFGYKDLKDAFSKAREIHKAGNADAVEVLKKELHEALKRNLDAQVASSAKDMYRGSAGQRFFVTSYLGDPEKVRRIVMNGSGAWILKPGGPEAVSDLLLEQVTALMPTSRRAMFAKVASDYAMYFKHGEGGIGGIAKYVDRIWEDVDENALLNFMDSEEDAALITARQIALKPQDASAILAEAKMSEAQVIEGVKRGMYQTVENQLMVDVNNLLTELEKIEAARGANAIDDLEALYNKQLIKFDLNDLANGLTALSDVPGGQPESILKILQREFGGRAMGPNVLGYIERQLKLLTGESADKISRRLLMTLLYTNEITPGEYYEINRHIQNGTALPDVPAAKKLRQARQEVLYLSSVDMLELGGGPNSIEEVTEEWRRQRSNAIIRSASDEIRQTVKELATLPADDLKALGWLEAEIRLPMETRLRIKLLPDQMADMAGRLQSRLSKQAISLMEWQRQTRQYIFSLTPTELGEAGDLGPMDAVFSVATGLYQTYSILNSSPALKPDEENLALANAWVTALPIVGDFANGMLSGIEAGFSGNKRKALEAGLYVSIGIMAIVPGGQIPAMVTGLIMAGAPIAEGVYDARHAQNLIQAWIDSGNWEGGGETPMVLNGLFDRAHVFHELTYADLLTAKGDVPYESEKADGLFTIPTINASIRDYSEKYVFPQYPKIKELRESLKLLFPNFNDKEWEDEFDAKLKVETQGGKAALFFFAEYRQIRTQALNRTIAQLKEWAEEEFQVAKDYEGEVNKAKEALRGLEAELKVGSLVTHADQSAEAYTKVVKNTMEQETLPLSRYRIYKHYVQEYKQIAVLHRKIQNRLAEVPEGYKPTNWHLTGYPEFDRPRIAKLSGMMDTGRTHAVAKVEKLIQDFGFYAKGGYDPDNPCHKKALQILLSHRYKVSFIENLVDYFTTLAEGESAWSDAYDAALSRYIEVRDRYADMPGLSRSDVTGGALGDAVLTFVAAMPYALASGERELYRSTASDFKIKMDKAMRDYEYAGFLTGEAGKALEDCLMEALNVDISLSPVVPDKGKTTRAKATLSAGTRPAQIYWRWKTDGALTLESPYGAEVEVTVQGPGVLTVEMMDDFRDRAKMLAQTSMRVVPIDDTDKTDDKDKFTSVAGDEALAQSINGLYRGNDWKGLLDLLETEKKNTAKYSPKDLAVRIDAVTQALEDLVRKRQSWVAEWEKYFVALEVITREAWDTVQEDMDDKQDVLEYKCNETCKDETCRKTCAEKAATYWKDCMGQLESEHAAELIRIDKVSKELIDKTKGITLSESNFQDYFIRTESLAKTFQIPFPYPEKVMPLLDYNLPCLEEDEDSDETEIEPEPPVVLDVTLKGPTQVIEVGTLVNLTASVGGGAAPYQYSWSGVSGSSASTSFTPAHVGDWSVSISVTDADGNTGEAIFTVRVGPAKVKIKGVKGEVFYGSQDFLSASGMGLKEPVPIASPVDCATNPESPFCVDTSSNATYTPTSRPEIPEDSLHREYEYVPDPDKEFETEPSEMEPYRVVWQSEPGLTFDPPEGPGEMTKVTYDRMGEVKVWCELLKNIDGAYQTVAESEQVTVNVIPPNISVSYEPANGKAYVGQQVIATLHAKPPVNGKLIDYRWFDPATSNRMELERNGSRISFTVRDTNPVKLKTLARVPVYGDEIGEVESTYTGIPYGVNAWMVQPPNLPRTWDPKAGGLKTIARGSRATGELIALKAELQGGAAPDGVRWKWVVNPGTTISNDISQTPTVSRSEAGSISARVTATTRDGSKLGEAEVTVEVVQIFSAPANTKTSPGTKNSAAANASDPNTAKTPADKKQVAQKIIDQSREHLSRGDMPAAAKSALQARELDPKSAAPVILEVANAAKKSGWRAGYMRDFPKAIEDLKVSDTLVPGNTDTQEKLKKLQTFEKIWPRVEAKVPEFDKYVAEKKPFSAQKAMLEIQNLQSDMPGGMSNPLSKRIIEDFQKAFKEYNTFALEWEQQNTEYFKEKNWQAILDIGLAAQKRELSPSKQKDVQGSIDLAKQMLAQQKQTGSIPTDTSDDQNRSGTSGLGQPGKSPAMDDKSDVSRTTGKTDFPPELRSPVIPAPPNPPVSEAKAGTSLKLAKTIYAPREEITLDFTASSEVPVNAWVGLIPDSIPHGSAARNDQNDTTFQSVKGQASGRMVFHAPAKAGRYGFRMSSSEKDQEILSVTFAVAVPEHTAVLALSQKIFAPNEEIKVDFEASLLMPQNTWVGLIPEDIPHGSTARNDQHDTSFQTVKGRASGQMVFRAPRKIGQYGFRMNETTNDKEVAAVSFEVAVPMNGNAFTLAKKIYAPHEEIKLDFTASSLLPNNTWVGLIPDSVPHGSTARNDQNDTSFQTVKGRASGQMVFRAPGKTGQYGFRMNETTNDKEVAAVSFEVAVPMNGNALTLTKKIYAPHEEIKLDFTASSLLPNNTWVGLIPDSVPHGSTARNDQNDTSFQTVKGRTSDQMVFRAPGKIGEYGFRMNETTNDKEVAAVSFEVAVPMDGNAFKLPKATFATGEEIKLNFTASPLLPNNTWVGLVPAEIPRGSTARNDQHDKSFQTVKGRASGQMVFNAPNKAGKYEFRMNETTNDKEVAHIGFTVMEGKK